MRPARLRSGISKPEPRPVRLHQDGNGGRNGKPDSSELDSGEWSVEGAEAVLEGLDGVISARVVLKERGELGEVHLLTGDTVAPKRTVRRVESAFIKNWGMKIDHRKVSVAQSRWPVGDKGKKAKSSASFLREPTFLVVDRPHLESANPRNELRFDGHEVELEPSGRMRVRVYLEAGGERFSGEATGSQRAKSRMSMLASATLRAVRSTKRGSDEDGEPSSDLALDDVDVVDAFKKDFVLASVSLLGADGVTRSAGAAPVEESLDRAVILSTLKAADPWVRGPVL